MKNRNLLIGAGVVVVGYLLYKKSQKDELNKRVQNLTKFADDSTKLTSEMGMKPNSFVIKSDGYNTTYSKGSALLGNTYIMTYSKISGRTDGSIGMGSPTIITSKEFEEAYNKFLQQPK